MGDIKKHRRKYNVPSHPWQRARIESEKIIMKEFGFKNKTEIWKMTSKLKNFKTQAKELVTKEPSQRALEEKQLLDRLYKLGLINKDATREKVLDLTENDIFNRRLQTIVFKKGLARSVKQARQFITHGHIFVHNNQINIPSYLVGRDEELTIQYAPNSQLKEEMHPERQRIMARKEEVKAEVKVEATPEVKTEAKIEVKENKEAKIEVKA